MAFNVCADRPNAVSAVSQNLRFFRSSSTTHLSPARSRDTQHLSSATDSRWLSEATSSSLRGIALGQAIPLTPATM